MAEKTSPQKEKIAELVEEARKVHSGGKTTPKRAPVTAEPEAEQKVQKTPEEKPYDIETNLFFQIIIGKDIAPEDKKKKIAEALTYDVNATPEENKRRQKEFELFKRYLHEQRTNMSKDIVALSETDTISQLRDMIIDITGGIKEYDETINPLTDIIDAIWTLRQQGKEMTLEVYKEIQQDKEAQARRDQEVADRTAEIARLEQQNVTDAGRIARLREQKTGLPFMKRTSPEALAQIAEIEAERASRLAELENKKKDLQALKDSPLTETKFAEFQKEKEQLRMLLDISGPEWKEKQQKLIDVSLKFIDTVATKGALVTKLLEARGEQIDTLNDANRGIQGIFRLVAEATGEAARANKGLREQMALPPDNEGAVQRTIRENKLARIEDFISIAQSSAVETAKSNADLAIQGHRVATLKAANIEQLQKAGELTSSGIAGVAEGIATTLTTISSASVNEAAEHAHDAIRIMTERTDLAHQKESLRQAAGYSELAENMMQNAERLRDTSVISKAAKEMRQESLEALNKAVKTSMEAMGELLEATAQERGTAANNNVAEGLSTDFNQEAANNNEPKQDKKQPAQEPAAKKKSGGAKPQ